MSSLRVFVGNSGADVIRDLNADLKALVSVGHDSDQIRGEPVPHYCLPDDIITSLGQPFPRMGRLFSEEQVQREREYAAFCNRHFAIGFFMGQSIVNTPLNPRLPLELPQSLVKELEWSKAMVIQAHRLKKQLDRCSVKVKGYCGFLLTHPVFLQETARLQTQWEQLPADQRPRFPLSRFIRVDSPSPPSREFCRRLLEYLDRFGLVQLATWDVPCPQGSLMPNPLPANAPALPRHGNSYYVPNHLHLEQKDTLLRDIAIHQKRSVRQANLSEEFASIGRYKKFAAMADIIHLERAIYSRFLERQHGLVHSIRAVISDHLGLHSESVQRHQKHIVALTKRKNS